MVGQCRGRRTKRRRIGGISSNPAVRSPHTETNGVPVAREHAHGPVRVKKAGRWVMNVVTIVSPGLKVLFERVGKPEIINRPEVLRLSGTAAVIACNHIGWGVTLWAAYAVYPSELRYMSKHELFNSPGAKWIFE